MDKDKILEAIRTCATMENHWYNGSNPSSSYKGSVEKVRHILEELLDVRECLEKKKKKDD